MINWLFSNVQNIVAVLEVVGFAVMGFFVFTGFFGSQNKERRTEADDLGDKLIARLQQTVDQQTKDIARMEDDMKRHTELRDVEIKKLQGDLSHLSGRNAVLEELFKGRDPKMQAFLNDAPKLMEIAHENNGLAKESSQAVTHLTDTLANFINTLQPLLIHLELKKPSTMGV